MGIRIASLADPRQLDLAARARLSGTSPIQAANSRPDLNVSVDSVNQNVRFTDNHLGRSAR
jgi:hypothetical protein